MKTTLQWTATIILAGLVVSACSNRKLTSDRSENVSKYILAEAPQTMDQEINANFEGKVMLLGYDVTPKTSVKKNQKFKVTWYWKALETPDPKWQLFTHVVNNHGRARKNVDKVGPVRQNFQPEHWKKGQIIADIQNIKVPAKWKWSKIGLRTGIFHPVGRIGIINGAKDSKSRGIGPMLTVEGTKKKKPVTAKGIQIPKVQTAPVIDGDITDVSWKQALSLPAFTKTMNGSKVDAQTEAKIMWDDKHIYVSMVAEDDFLQSKFTKHDDELWREDAFEIFLDPGGDKLDYFEIQVSPANIVFDSLLPKYRKNQNDWSSKAVTAVKVDGSLNDTEGEDKGWQAEIAIPLEQLKTGLKSGDKWTMNMFRVNKREGKTEYSAWAPPMRGDFHALDKFVPVIFIDGSKKTIEKKPAQTTVEKEAKVDSPKKETAEPKDDAKTKDNAKSNDAEQKAGEKTKQ